MCARVTECVAVMAWRRYARVIRRERCTCTLFSASLFHFAHATSHVTREYLLPQLRLPAANKQPTAHRSKASERQLVSTVVTVPTQPRNNMTGIHRQHLPAHGKYLHNSFTTA